MTFATALSRESILSNRSDIIQLIFTHLSSNDFNWSRYFPETVRRAWVDSAVRGQIGADVDGRGISIKKSISSFCLRATGPTLSFSLSYGAQ